MKIKSNNKASALVVSLLILSVIVITALSLSLVSIRERNASIGESKSNLVFQAADTGVEEVMYDILKGGHALTDPVSDLSVGDCSGSDGFIKKTEDSVEIYYVELLSIDLSGVYTKIDCDDSGKTIGEIAAIKAVSKFSGESRAIMAAVSFP